MKYHGLEIDLSGIAALVTAITSLFMVVKGTKIKKKKGKEEKNA